MIIHSFLTENSEPVCDQVGGVCTFTFGGVCMLLLPA